MFGFKEDEIWNTIHELSDIRAQYNLFDDRDRFKYHAISVAIKMLRKMIKGDEEK